MGDDDPLASQALGFMVLSPEGKAEALLMVHLTQDHPSTAGASGIIGPSVWSLPFITHSLRS